MPDTEWPRPPIGFVAGPIVLSALSIIGGSGTGKSVTLKTILGLLRPDEGEVWVDGHNVHQLTREQLYELRRKVGYVFQFAALFDSMTIRENVAMGLRRIKTMTEGEIQHRVSACLYLVDLEGAEGMLNHEAEGDGFWQYQCLNQFASRIGGGTEEVHRNNLAEQALGLPRDQRTDLDVPWKDLPRG